MGELGRKCKDAKYFKALILNPEAENCGVLWSFKESYFLKDTCPFRK
jgi:hypothetical protein